MRYVKVLKSGTSVVALVLGIGLTPALAQDSGVETVVVTGSRIARKDADSWVR